MYWIIRLSFLIYSSILFEEDLWFSFQVGLMMKDTE